MTVAKVAERAGVGNASIYRRWDSKEALLLTAWRALTVDPPDVDTGSWRTDLEEIMREQSRAYSSPMIRSAVPHLIAAARVEPAAAEVFRDLDEARRRVVETALERAVARGELRPDTDLDALKALLTFSLSQVVLYDRAVDDETIKRVLDIIERGVAASATNERDQALEQAEERRP